MKKYDWYCSIAWLAAIAIITCLVLVKLLTS